MNLYNLQEFINLQRLVTDICWRFGKRCCLPSFKRLLYAVWCCNSEQFVIDRRKLIIFWNLKWSSLPLHVCIILTVNLKWTIYQLYLSSSSCPFPRHPFLWYITQHSTMPWNKSKSFLRHSCHNNNNNNNLICIAQVCRMTSDAYTQFHAILHRTWFYLVSVVGAEAKVEQVAVRVRSGKALTIWRPFTVKYGSVTLTFNLHNCQQTRFI